MWKAWIGFNAVDLFINVLQGRGVIVLYLWHIQPPISPQ